MCGSCCYGEGGITLGKEDVRRIAQFLNITERELIDEFCYIRHGRISVITGPDSACIFYETEKGCLVHPVKPDPCRRWPYYDALIKDKDNWELAKDACPGIVRDCSHEEFVTQAKQWLSSNT